MSATTTAAAKTTTPPAPSPQSKSAGASERAWEVLANRLGKRYAGCRLNNYDCREPAQESVRDTLQVYVENLRSRVEAGQSIILYGPKGTGKDHLMAALMRVGAMTGLRVRWENGADLFGQFRDAIRGTDTEGAIVDRYTKADILALSDPVPPLGKLTEYQAMSFFRIVDRRYRDVKPTWITINAKDRAEAEQRISPNIIDRLGEGALALFCNWTSYRRK